MKKTTTNNKKKGFSIIEILVVMTITLILLSIMAPKYMTYRDKAKELKAVDLGRKIYSVYLDSYMNEGAYDGIALKTDIKTMLGINEDQITPSEESGIVTILYPCDGKDYSIEVDETSGNFIVQEGTKEIYSSNQYATVSQSNEEDND
jgi:type IV pilus assembly protein PilA